MRYVEPCCWYEDSNHYLEKHNISVYFNLGVYPNKMCLQKWLDFPACQLGFPQWWPRLVKLEKFPNSYPCLKNLVFCCYETNKCSGSFRQFFRNNFILNHIRLIWTFSMTQKWRGKANNLLVSWYLSEKFLWNFCVQPSYGGTFCDTVPVPSGAGDMKFRYEISPQSYLTSVSVTKLRWHVSDMNVICRIWPISAEGNQMCY